MNNWNSLPYYVRRNTIFYQQCLSLKFRSSVLSQIYKPLGHFPVKKMMFSGVGAEMVTNTVVLITHFWASFYNSVPPGRPQEFIQENTIAWANQIFILWPGLSQYKIMEYSILYVIAMVKTVVVWKFARFKSGIWISQGSGTSCITQHLFSLCRMNFFARYHE